MAKTLSVKADGGAYKLLTSEYDANWWPSLTIANGIFTNQNQVGCIVRAGSGYLRANAILAADWPNNETREICTLPEGARPEVNVATLVHGGRFYLYIGTNGKVTLQNKAGAALSANSAAEFCVGYPLKIVGGG